MAEMCDQEGRLLWCNRKPSSMPMLKMPGGRDAVFLWKIEPREMAFSHCFSLSPFLGSGHLVSIHYSSLGGQHSSRVTHNSAPLGTGSRKKGHATFVQWRTELHSRNKHPKTALSKVHWQSMPPSSTGTCFTTWLTLNARHIPEATFGRLHLDHS